MQILSENPFIDVLTFLVENPILILVGLGYFIIYSFLLLAFLVLNTWAEIYSHGSHDNKQRSDVE